MQITFRRGGFDGKGDVFVETKKKTFKIEGKFSASFDLSSKVKQQLDDDVLDRFIAVTGSEVASKWPSYDQKAVKIVQKRADKIESEWLKAAKKLEKRQASFKDIKRLNDATREKIKTFSEQVYSKEATKQFEALLAKAEKIGHRSLDASAKSVMGSAGARAYSAILNQLAFVVKAGGTVAAAAGVGTAAAGPIGAALGAGVGITVAIISAVKSGVDTVTGLAKDIKKVRKDLRSNYERYEDAYDELDKKIDEMIRVSRALTARWDRLKLRQAQLNENLAEIESSVPPDAADNHPRIKKAMRVKRRIELKSAPLQQMLNYKPQEIEAALTKVRQVVRQKCDPKNMKPAVDETETWATDAQDAATGLLAAVEEAQAST